MARPKKLVPTLSLVCDKKSGIFHATYTCPDGGYTKKVTTGERDEKRARAKLPAISAKVMAGKRPGGSDLTVGDLLTAYDRDRAKGAKSTGYHVNTLTAYFGGFTVSELRSDAAIKGYRSWRTGQSNVNAAPKAEKKLVSDSTACKELNVLRAALAYGHRNGWEGLDTRLPLHIPNVPTSSRQTYLTQEQARKLLAACVEPHTALFVRVALATGARMSAILELTWADVTWPSGGKAPSLSDFDAKDFVDTGDFVESTDGKSSRSGGWDFAIDEDNLQGGLRVELGQGRGNKKRGIGVITKTNTKLYKALAAAFERKTCPYIIEWHGKNIGKINLEPAYKRAGLTGFVRRQHLLKHTCCSWMVQGGVSYEKIAKVVGTDAKTIEKVYGHLSPEHLETIGDLLNVE